MRTQLRAASWIIALIVLAAACGGAEDRSLEVTFDGENCTYDGPGNLTAGEVDIVFHNQSTNAASGFMDFVRLDDDKTVQDVNDYLASDAIGAPTWVTRVYLADFVPNESSTDQVTRTVQSGVHAFVCGTNSPYSAHYGDELNVAP